MPQTHSISRLLVAFRRWWHSLAGGAGSHQRTPLLPPPENESATPLPLFPEGQAFEEFLHQLGVTMEGSRVLGHRLLQATSTITILQQSRHRDAFYRVDQVQGRPSLLILMPTEHLLTFRGYLVRFHESHPLSATLDHLASFPGSADFEQERSIIEEHLLSAIAEAMKVLFWTGFATGHFPPEIVVQRLTLIGEASDETER